MGAKEPIVKICENCKSEYEIPHRKRSQANKRRFCSKKCSSTDPSLIEKRNKSQEKTFKQKYGKHPMQTERGYENFKQSLKEKYGVEYTMQRREFLEFARQTKELKYGDPNYNNVDKMKDTCLRLYGVDNVRKIKDVINSVNEQVKDQHYLKLQELCKKCDVQMLFSRPEYLGYHFSNIYPFKCLNCGNEFHSTVFKLSNIFCNKCHPDQKQTLENSFFEFLKQVVPSKVEIRRNDRTILLGKELDFYIPFKKIAFELNGLYWHSEVGGGRDRFYHVTKSKNCLFHGVRLVHILESEWNSKQELVKSVIKNILGYAPPNRVFARHCEIREIGIQMKDEFLELNHLQGKDKSTVKLGLFFNNELVSVMTFRKSSRFDKKIDWELMRFCNKVGFSVVGGASKLFAYFTKRWVPNNVVSYSDKRYFDGNLYTKLGFNYVHDSTPNYHYITDNYKGLKGRMSFQKHKLKEILPVFDASLSEWENMKNNGFDRIWDCGNSKWIWRQP
jgi:hypothetical protein